MTETTETTQAAPAAAPAAQVAGAPAAVVPPAAPDVAALTAKLADAEAKIAQLADLQDRVAKMASAADTEAALRERVAQLDQRLDSQRKSALEAALTAAGVDPADFALVPQHLDPHTTEGRQELQAFLAKHPRLIARPAQAAPAEIDIEALKSKAKVSPLFPWQMLRRLQAGGE